MSVDARLERSRRAAITGTEWSHGPCPRHVQSQKADIWRGWKAGESLHEFDSMSDSPCYHSLTFGDVMGVLFEELLAIDEGCSLV